MKFLITILSTFFWVNAIAQVSFSGGGTTDGPTSLNSSSWTRSWNFGAVGSVWVVWVQTTGTSSDVTVSSAGTNQPIQIGSIGDATRRLQAFVVYSRTAEGSVTLTFTASGGTTGRTNHFHQVLGARFGAAVKQVVTSSGTSANPSITMNQLMNSSAVEFAFVSSVTPFNGTPEAGWTERSDGGYTVPDTGWYMAYSGPTTDNTITVTSASSTWIGMAIEFVTNRRIIQSN